MNMLLSIVIVNYNYGKFLETAIDSIVIQDMSDKVELIICDGGSTDNSIEIIKKYSDKLAWWCSEKDGGQSAAFNKGFRRASGRYLTWLNADDYMPMGSLRRICKVLEAHPTCDWFTGNFYRFDDVTHRITEVCWGPNFYPAWMQTKKSPLVVYGPSTIFSRSIYEKVGGMDENYHYAMDTDLWTRFLVFGVKQKRIRAFCWGFRIHRESKTEGDGQQLSLARNLSVEHAKTRQKTGFSPSGFMKLVLHLWRIVDGSYLYSYHLRYKMIGNKISIGV